MPHLIRSTRCLFAIVLFLLLPLAANAQTPQWHVLGAETPGHAVPGPQTFFQKKGDALLALRSLAQPATLPLTEDAGIVYMSDNLVRYKYVAPPVNPTVSPFEYWFVEDIEERRFSSEAAAFAALQAWHDEWCSRSFTPTPTRGWLPMGTPGSSSMDNRPFEVQCFGFGAPWLIMYRERTYTCPQGYGYPPFIGLDANGNEYPLTPCTSTWVGYIDSQVLECPVTGPSPIVANPCNAATGDKSQTETDYAVGGLRLARSYHSASLESSYSMGIGWSHNFSARLVLSGGVPVGLRRSDGHHDAIRNLGGEYLSLSGAGIHVRQDGTQWIASLGDGSREVYDSAGNLKQLKDRSGKTTMLAYTSGRLASITGPFGHSLQFVYTNGLLSSVIDPAGASISYSYTAGNLTQVTFQDGKYKIYHYEDAAFPNHLTGITDEGGVRFSTYSYDSSGRVVSSSHAGGVGQVTLNYGSTSTNFVDAAGAITSFSFTSDSLLPRRVTGVSNEGLTQSYAAGLM